MRIQACTSILPKGYPTKVRLWRPPDYRKMRNIKENIRNGITTFELIGVRSPSWSQNSIKHIENVLLTVHFSQPLPHLLKIEQGFAQGDEHGDTHGAGWQDDEHGDEQDEYDEHDEVHGCAQDVEHDWTGVLKGDKNEINY